MPSLSQQYYTITAWEMKAEDIEFCLSGTGNIASRVTILMVYSGDDDVQFNNNETAIASFVTACLLYKKKDSCLLIRDSSRTKLIQG